MMLPAPPEIQATTLHNCNIETAAWFPAKFPVINEAFHKQAMQILTSYVSYGVRSLKCVVYDLSLRTQRHEAATLRLNAASAW